MKNDDAGATGPWLDRDGVAEHPVEVRTDSVHVRRVADDVGVREAKRRYGGLDLPAAVAGTLAAIGTLVLLGAALAAAGALARREDAAGESALRTGAIVAGLLTAAIAVAVGAWVAGRMARYDGGRNGLLTALLFILALAAISGAGLGLGDAATDGDVGTRLSDWWDPDAFGPLGIAGALAALAVLLGLGWLFGKVGERYHRHADELIVNTREGAIVRDGGLVGGVHEDGLSGGLTNPGAVSTASRDLSRELPDDATRPQKRLQ